MQDKILSVCESKFSDQAIGISVGKELRDKISQIEDFNKKSIKKVLLTNSKPSRELISSDLFSKIVLVEELFEA